VKIDLPQGVDMKSVSNVLNAWVARIRSTAADFHWREAIIHPLVFAVFPILSLYVKNMGDGFLREALGITMGGLVLAGLFWLLVSTLVKNKRKSAIIVSAFFVLFFSYGHVLSALSTALERLDLLDEARFLVEGRRTLRIWLVGWAGLFAAVSGWVVRVKKDLRSLTTFLNVVALALALMVAANGVAGGVSMYWPHVRARIGEHTRANDSSQVEGDMKFRQFLPLVLTSVPDKGIDDETIVDEFLGSWQEGGSTGDVVSASSPDIYYIIVDAYGRADILKEIYGIDNSEFLSYLGEKGFYVADESFANYPQTALSLSSSLNFMYLDGLVERIGEGTSNRQPLEAMIKNNRFFRYLRDRGYTLVSFSSGYGPTDITDADVYMAPRRPWKLTEFQEALVMLTPLSMFSKVRSDFHRDRVTYALNHIADAAQVDGPALVLAHITAPHFPFIFDADGHPIQPPRGIGNREDYSYDEYIEGYRNQLTFITERLQVTVEEILSHSAEPPIIILQADHGPCARLAPGWNVEDTYVSERMAILNAYYFPDQDYGSLYEAISPVNTFRVVLNDYFGTDYGLLEDRSYFSSWGRPYLFTEVTDDVLVGR